jgi:hypothetical protein
MYLEECKHCINSQHGMPAMRKMFNFKIFFISLQETIQRPFENDDSLEQKKQQTTEKSSATTPTGQSTGKKVTVISTNLYLKRRHNTVLKDFKRGLYTTVNLEMAATQNIS